MKAKRGRGGSDIGASGPKRARLRGADSVKIEGLDEAIRTNFSDIGDGSISSKNLIQCIEDHLSDHGRKPVEQDALIGAINGLIARHIIQVYELNNKETCYKLVQATQSAAMRSLGHEERQVLQVVQAEARNGISKPNISRKCAGLKNEPLERILTLLVERKLIHFVRSPRHRNQKMYLSFGLEPGPDLVGNVFYIENGSDYDTVMIETLAKVTQKYLSDNSMASAADILRFITEKRVLQVELTEEDMRHLLRTMVHDGIVERVAKDGDEDQYHLVRGSGPRPGFFYAPCSSCKLLTDCSETGLVTPTSCVYMRKWLGW